MTAVMKLATSWMAASKFPEYISSRWMVWTLGPVSK